MSIEMIENEIQRFLEKEESLALCLRGRWGVGKTYAWNNIIKEAFKNKKVNPLKYSYVSLFGVESLKDVRRRIFENTIGEDSFNNLDLLKESSRSYLDRSREFIDKIKKGGWRFGAGQIIDVPVVADYLSWVESVAFSALRDQIVCFDDLERISDGLSLKDLIGFMSFLKEERRCKIVLILNNEALDGKNKEEFNSQIEKLLDINLVFSPTPEEVCDIAIGENTSPCTGLVKKFSVHLGISNIRTVIKLIRIADRLAEILVGYDERVLERSINNACLYGFSLYQPLDAPPIDFILKDHLHSFSLNDSDKENSDIIKWSELLRGYGYLRTDDFGLEILKSIDRGVYDEEMIREKADYLIYNIILGDKEKEFDNAWSIFYDSFDENSNEFSERLINSIMTCAECISPVDLSSSIRVLKQLGYGGLVNGLIESYMEKRKNDMNLWSAEDFSLLVSRLSDPDLVKIFSEKMEESCKNMSFVDVMIGIGKNRQWNRGELEFIDSYDSDFFYKKLKETKGDDLRFLINGIMFIKSFSDSEGVIQSIFEKFVSALERLGSESKINELRVRRLGIVKRPGV